MKLFFLVVFAAFLAGNAFAEDSTAIAEKRRKERTSISFWCETGRTPIVNSLEGLNIRPSKNCTFGGTLDSKITPLILEPPFLNPFLSLDDLRQFLLRVNGTIDSESNSAIQFRVNGERFIANRVPHQKLKDTYLRLGFFPPNWPTTMISIAGASAQAIRMLSDSMQSLAPNVFAWDNPYFQEETATWSRIGGGPRSHMPLEIVPRCRVKEFWNPAGRSLLLVGDMHNPTESRYFLNLIQTMPAAFAAIEISRNRDIELKEFLDAKSVAEENHPLDKIVARLPNDLMDDFRNIFRTLKRRQIPIVLMDYQEPYFNFPFTNTAFHGGVLALRNKLWVERLPAHWNGSGVLLGGLAHFTDMPGSDVQNFLVERFPGLNMGLINPLEVCN